MGAAASTGGSKEFRDLHNALVASGTEARTLNLTDLEFGTHFGRIEKLALRLITAEQSIGDSVRIDQVEPGYGTTLLFAAAAAGGEQCLTVIKLLRKHSPSYEIFLRALSWRHPESGLTCLHVSRNGKAAASLLRAGCKCLETREFKLGMTPLQWATMKDNHDLVAVLHSWGATDNGPYTTEKPNMKNRATAIALFNTVPERPKGNYCWLILHDLIPLARFTGIQFMNSSKIGDMLRSWNIVDLRGDTNLPVSKKITLFGIESCLEDEKGRAVQEQEDQKFEENMQTTQRDLIEIRYLPEEFKEPAYLFDLDGSGTITIDELRKMVRLREHRKGEKIEIDEDRFNTLAGGEVLVRASQPRIKMSGETKLENTLMPTRRTKDELDHWYDHEEFIPKYKTTTIKLPFAAALQMSLLHFGKKESEKRTEKNYERKMLSEQIKTRVNLGVMTKSNSNKIDPRDHNTKKTKLTTSYIDQQNALKQLAELKENPTIPAGHSNNVCQKYGGESGDAPSFLKTTNIGSDYRSRDLYNDYIDSDVHQNKAKLPYRLPKSYVCQEWQQNGSGYVIEPRPNNDTFERTMEAALKKEASLKAEPPKLNLWRPIGNRSVISGITEEDHIV